MKFVDLSFIIPALVFYCVFFIYPSICSVFYSFTSWSGLEKVIHFVGFSNYAKIFRDDRVFASLSNTFIITIVVVIAQNVCALALAVALNDKIKTRNLIRTVFFMPALLSALVIGFVWSYILNPVDGLLNTVLDTIGLHALSIDWLGRTDTALYAVIFVILWQCTGYAMVIYLAGLKNVPIEYYEAASIDGSNEWQRFRSITFPLIAPSFTINILLSTIGCLKTFDVIFAMTQGGPGYATETIATVIFAKAFGSENEFSYGTSIAVVLFILIFIVSLFMVNFLRKRELEL